jgi:YbaB/EbfC DNA-binding family protein
LTQFDSSGGTDPIAGFTAEFEELKARAEDVQNRIRTASATAQSPDGAATVTVGPGGALLNLAFGNRAYRRPPAALAALVLQLIGTAQKQVSAQVAGAFGDLVGENSAAMGVLQEFLPPVPESDEPVAASPPPSGPLPVPPAPPAPPRPAQQEPLRPARRTGRPAEDDDEDFTEPW